MGPATAHALNQAGYRVALQPAGNFDSEALLEHPRLEHLAGHRILIIKGRNGRPFLEQQLAQRPKIHVPVITLYGADDGIARPAVENPNESVQFTALRARRIITGAGHFLPREKPEAVSSALLELLELPAKTR